MPLVLLVLATGVCYGQEDGTADPTTRLQIILVVIALIALLVVGIIYGKKIFKSTWSKYPFWILAVLLVFCLLWLTGVKIIASGAFMTLVVSSCIAYLIGKKALGGSQKDRAPLEDKKGPIKDNKKLAKESKDLEAKNKKLENDNSKLKEENEKLKEENEKLKEENNKNKDLGAKNKKSEDDNSKLKKENEKLKKELSENPPKKETSPAPTPVIAPIAPPAPTANNLTADSKILYSDTIIDGYFNRLSETPDEDTVFELHLQSTQMASFTIYVPSYQRVIFNSSFLEGCEKQVLNITQDIEIVRQGAALLQANGRWHVDQKLNVVIN